MAISTLRIVDFRNLIDVDLAPYEAGINIFYGANGSGKSSLLEAIYYLGFNRSFRYANSNHLIRWSTKKLAVIAKLLINNCFIPLGVERDAHGQVQIRLAEKNQANIAELARALPLRVIHSQSHQLFEAGPMFRRKYLDWGLFYHFEGFLNSWRHFERALKQRNILLREKSFAIHDELDAWTHELVKYGLELDHYRRQYVAMLTPILEETTSQLLSQPGLTITYQAGWDESLDYGRFLQQIYADDCRAGYTQVGPHRADLQINFNEIAAKHLLSRGQQKLMICAMILAQGILLKRELNKGLIYLVDDLPSELDMPSRSKLISLFAAQQTQTFITAIDSQDIYKCVDNMSAIPMKVFHVEQGHVVER